jgi:hypothetical protein
MELMLLLVRVAIWMAGSSGGGPTTEDLEECARGQIIPC